jgi:hypothetical protein
VSSPGPSVSSPMPSVSRSPSVHAAVQKKRAAGRSLRNDGAKRKVTTVEAVSDPSSSMYQI